MKSYYIYILTNKNNTVLYVGVTNDIVRRIWEHKSKLIEGFTKKYNIDKLVYYEKFDDPNSNRLRSAHFETTAYDGDAVHVSCHKRPSQPSSLGR